MKNLNKAEQQALKSLLQDSRFDIVLKLHEEVLDGWRRETGVGFNEFETLKLTFVREGRIEGLKSFFEYLDDQAVQGAEE